MVEGMVHAVDDRTGPEEEAGLEKGVGHEVKMPAVKAPTPIARNMKPSWETVE